MLQPRPIVIVCFPILATAFAEFALAQDFETMPFDSPREGADVVFTADDPAEVELFYGAILGLSALDPVDVPDYGRLLRYGAGASELKFLVNPQAQPGVPGGRFKARGLRMVTVFVNDGDAVIERMKQHGLDTAEFFSHDGQRFGSGSVLDFDGNEVHVVFLPETLDAKNYGRMRVGLTVADMDVSRKFYGDVLGFHEIAPSSSAPEDTKYNFQAGWTTIRFINRGPDLPPPPARPDAVVGMHALQFFVADVEALHEKLADKDIPIVQPPTRYGDMATAMTIVDPDGVRLDFVQLAAP